MKALLKVRSEHYGPKAPGGCAGGRPSPLALGAWGIPMQGLLCWLPGHASHPAPSARQDKKACFSMYNPVAEAEYREVISRWVVILLILLDEVAAPPKGGS